MRTAAVIPWVGLASEAHAHALAQRYDLPLPLGFFLLAAAAVVAFSFLILAMLGHRAGNRSKISRPVLLRLSLPRPLVAVCQALGLALLTLVVAAGLFGIQRPFKNIAPVSFWVIGWVGLSFLSAFVGNVWTLINPWSGGYSLAHRFAGPFSPLKTYPRWLGAWPAAILFLIFAWLELVAPGRDVPRNIALGLLVYSAVTWTGFALFGRKAWLRGGEVFAVVFGLFARFAPLHVSKRSIVLRPYAAGLIPQTPLAPSMIAFTLLVLGTVTADGLMETPLWVGLIEGWFADPAGVMMAMSALLLLVPLALAALYLATMAGMARLTGADTWKLAGWFVLSLVPIAIGYSLAHYFSLFMIAGQFIIPLISDPLGWGWDLFGTTLYRIDIGVVDAKFIWYLSVIAIVTGHVIAVYLGHVTALALFRDGALARRSQYPLLALMIAYTMLSLWIIAQPITEASR